MRTCGDYAELQLWAAMPGAAEFARAEHLAVVRFELIERGDAAAGWVDLIFVRDGRTCVVPGLVLELTPALGGDPKGILWPRAAAAYVDEAEASALGAIVLERFARRLAGRAVPTEAVEVLVGCPAFEAARAGGELGAAPLATVLPRVAPWIYAARLAGAGPVRLDGTDAALGAAVLRRFGVTALGVLAADSAAWYGIAPSECGDDPPVVPVVALHEPTTDRGRWQAMGIAPPAPMNQAIAFIVDGTVGRFWVRLP